MRAAILCAMLCLLNPAGALAQDSATVLHEPTSIQLPGIDPARAGERLDFWRDLLDRIELPPGHDYGEGEILLTADRDMRDRYAISLRLPAAAQATEKAWLRVIVIQSVGLPWIEYWEAQIPADEGRALMLQADNALSVLPSEDSLGGCLHAVEGAIERRRGVTVTRRGVDFCRDDGEAIWPIYQAFILTAQGHAEGCEPLAEDERGNIRRLYDCLSLSGNRGTAREVREITLARFETLDEQVLWDIELFGGGDFVIVTGWWANADYPPPEIGRQRFTEIWRRQNGAWALEQSLGSAPPLPEFSQ